MRRYGFCGCCSWLTLLLCLGMLPPLPGSTAWGAAKQQQGNREEAQKSLFSFIAEFYNWAGYFYLLRKDETQDIKQVYLEIKQDKVEKFHQLLDRSRQVLLDLNRYSDLNLLEGVEIIPNEIYEFLRRHFAISSLQAPIPKDEPILKLIGGNFDYGEEQRRAALTGFLDVVASLDLNRWQPVKKFINNFESTVNRDLRLVHLVGKSLLPLVRHYFSYLDVITRLRIFKEVVDDALVVGIDGEDLDSDVDKIAIKVFQNTGPVMMKLLQQLQDETKGETEMTRVLKGIEHCKPMAEKKAFTAARNELLAISGNRDLDDKHYGFRFRTVPLGIASIAQTHLFRYGERDYVVKIQKEKVEDVFRREAKALAKLVATEEEFDKGMKQKIANIHAGILEELDFNYERRNIETGFLAYHDPDNGILTIENPSELRNPKVKGPLSGGRQVLIMTKAEGHALGKIMERGDGEELINVYQVIQKLYEKFLYTGLSPASRKNFYHGDLHRGNIFFDPKSKNLTLIDFGNAGELSRDIRQALLEIYAYIDRTYADSEKSLDKAVLNLAKVMQDFVFKFNRERIDKSKTTGPLVKTFFSSCFNPALTPRERINGGRFLTGKSEELKELKRIMAARIARGEKTVSEADLNIVQDDIDFIKALQNNCFNGPINPLLLALGNPKMLVSDKLNTVFQELQKNGIVMPKEVIFFNKSKALLEGILTNLDNSLAGISASYSYVDPDEIYKRVLTIIAEQSSCGSSNQSVVPSAAADSGENEEAEAPQTPGNGSSAVGH